MKAIHDFLKYITAKKGTDHQEQRYDDKVTSKEEKERKYVMGDCSFPEHDNIFLSNLTFYLFHGIEVSGLNPGLCSNSSDGCSTH